MKDEVSKEIDLNDLNDEEKALYQLSTPMALTDFMLKRPCCTVCVGYMIMLAVSIFVYVMGWVIPQNPNDRDYMVWGDPYMNNWDKTLLVKEALLTDTSSGEIAL